MKSLSILCAALAVCAAMPAEDGFTVKPLRDETIDAFASVEDFKKFLETDRIVGGAFESPAHSNPWQALVMFGGSLCGGTILNSRFILTAGHCIPSNPQTSATIIAGASTWCSMTSTGAISWVSEATQQKTTVKTIYRMSGSLAYGSNGQLFDIAILEVATPFTMNANVVAAKLPTARTAVGTNLVVSGWGTTSEGGRISCTLKQVTVPLVSKADCNAYYGNIKSSQLCAGLKTGGIDSCQGDSGGPLVVKRSSLDATVVGVVSYGAGCARPNAYGVYTDVFTFLPWINSVLGVSSWPGCPSSTTSRIGDGTCNTDLNTAGCFFDAGDCATSG